MLPKMFRCWLWGVALLASLSLLPSAAAQDRAPLLAEVARLEQQIAPLTQAGRYPEAIPLAVRVVELTEQAWGAEHLNLAPALTSLALYHEYAGQYREALPPMQHAAQLYEKNLGPAHPDTATALNNLAFLWLDMGDDVQAQPLFQRALAIREQALGKEHAVVADSLTGLGFVYQSRAAYSQAAPLLQRALAIREKTLGATHINVAGALRNLALLFYDQGDYAQAQPLFQRALAIYEKALGAEHPYIALALNDLASLYQDQGDFSAALPLLQRGLAIQEKVAAGTPSPNLAVALNNLGGWYHEQNDDARALPFFERALAMREKVLGAEHPDVANSLNNIAEVYRARGDKVQAQQMMERVLALREKAYGPTHPTVASALNNLASLHHKLGDDAQAIKLYRRALEIFTGTLGVNYPLVAVTLDNLAIIYQTQKDLPQAVNFKRQAAEVREKNLIATLDTGSQQQKQLYLNNLAYDVSSTLSLHLQAAPNNPDAAHLALETLLRRKGRALDAFANQLAVLRQRATPADRVLLEQLAAARAQAAALSLKGQANSPLVKQLETDAARLEDAISRRSAEFRAVNPAQPVTVDRVAAALPSDAALVELAAYEPFDPNAKDNANNYGALRYVAYVLRPDGTITAVDLGEAAPIDAALARFRAVLPTPRSDIVTVKALARELDEKLMRPVRDLLGPTRRVLLAPDGSLNLIPFGALVDENGRYLLENYSFDYLTSGRDLLRLPATMGATEPVTTKGATVIIANPQFDLTRPMETCAGTQRGLGVRPVTANGAANATAKGAAKGATNALATEFRALDFTQFCYTTLAGTAQEAVGIRQVLPAAQVWTQQTATEAAVKKLSRPRVLHLATHGFFLPDQIMQDAACGTPDADCAKSGTSARKLGLESSAANRPPQSTNPLLRSGLVLAGVKQARSGPANDGILTAQEAAGLDLFGTELVILSACETGLGDAPNGQGVYGLRRALVLAGSATQVMSLWRVSDAATQELMVAYYQRLQSGAGRIEALQAVQLAMLRGGALASADAARELVVGVAPKAPTVPSAATEYAHPYYWASFIASGAWQPLTPTLQPKPL